MAENTHKCGDNAVEIEISTSTLKRDGSNITVHHTKVDGSGCVTTCRAQNTNYNDWHVTVNEGITSLGDKCYSVNSVKSVILPTTLRTIGNECFRYAHISKITLPEGLTKMGTENFGPKLENLHIPSTLTDFPMGNFLSTENLNTITVHEDNPSFCVHNGILYTRDMRTLLFCPCKKEGIVVVPEGVTELGYRCFASCTKITRLHLPTTLKKIGQYAFCYSVHSKLIIPNSVETVEKGAFYHTKVSQTFKFSNRVEHLPEECFEDASLVDYSFIRQMKTIGNKCFFTYAWDKLSPMPENLQLLRLEKLGSNAFHRRSEIKKIEFSKNLRYLHSDAFYNMDTYLQIRIHSLIPYNPGNEIINVNSWIKLVVPIGCAAMYRNSAPWMQFSNIVELETEKDEKDGDIITDFKLLRSRLESITQSIQSVDREYTRNLLQNLIYDYQEISTDKDFEEAKQVIFYNRRFTPALIPDMEIQMIGGWPEHYKLLLLNEMLKKPVSPLQFKENKLAIGCGNFVADENAGQPILASLMTDDVETESSAQGPEIYFESLLEILQTELSKTEKTLDIAVSWFTNHALYRLVGELADKGVKVRLLINNDSVNNGGYCLDFNQLLAKGVRMSLVEYPHMLHHKFCVIDGLTVINGSYNWTRFSGKNYENLTLFRQQQAVAGAFTAEFENLWEGAEHKDIDKMPETVPSRPEYDRNAFRQYVTEELDAQAREVSDNRVRITALHRASTLNAEWLDTINPTARTEYADAFEVADKADAIRSEVLHMTHAKQPKVQVQSEQTGKNIPSDNNTVIPEVKTDLPPVAEEKIKDVMASQLYLTLDISGSMEDNYNRGHVKNISRQAVAAALAVSESKEVSLWTFGDNSRFVGNVSLQNLDLINQVGWKHEGTNLSSFISSAISGIGAGALVIIFTDDDGGSLSTALPAMKSRPDVYWQIIACEQQCNNIQPLVQQTENISLVNCLDYGKMSEVQLHNMLLHDFIQWNTHKKSQNC